MSPVGTNLVFQISERKKLYILYIENLTSQENKLQINNIFSQPNKIFFLGTYDSGLLRFRLTAIGSLHGVIVLTSLE